MNMDYPANEPCGPAEYCWLSYEAENVAEKTSCASFVFRETGEWDDHEAVTVTQRKPQDQMERFISRFIGMSKEILGDHLAGIYFHGSAVMGCYQPKKSDLDFLIVVNTALSDAEKLRFMERLLELDQECPGKGIEMSIVTKDVCNPFVYPTPFILHYSRMHTGWYLRDPEDYIRKMKGTDKDLAAHFTVIDMLKPPPMAGRTE